MALSRVYALSRTLWDWDEVLFSSALIEFDVTQHHPHPPGFPLFVALAKLARLVIQSDFRALQAITLLFALALFPAMFALGRALRMSFAESFIAALVLVFLPNVWFYGGTAFSDIPALTMVVAAAAALFASRRGGQTPSSVLFYFGSLLLGAAIAIRPQNALIGMYPWLAAAWPRLSSRKREIALGASCVIAVVAIAYSGAALASRTFSEYVSAVRTHEDYVRSVDSFRNPGRPPLHQVFKLFIINPFEAKRLALTMWIVAAIGLLRLRRPAVESVLTFGPFLLFAWVMLDLLGASRLSIGFMPLLAMLIAHGISLLANLLSFRKPRVEIALQAVLAGALVMKLLSWTVPALAEVRRSVSPPVAATEWVVKNLDPHRVTLYVHVSMAPWSDYFLGRYRKVFVEDNFSADSIGDTRDAWLLTEGITAFEDGVNFRRPRGRVWHVVRRRHFEVSARPLSSSVTFGDGWYGEESSDVDVWRWMGRRSVTRLAPISRPGDLLLRLYFPLDGLRKPPLITISLNGSVLERFTPAEAIVERKYALPPSAQKPSELVIETDEVVQPRGDPRPLGVRLDRITWRAR